MHVCFMALENAYDKVSVETLWQELRMYDVSGNQLNSIKNTYVQNLAYVKYKELSFFFVFF